MENVELPKFGVSDFLAVLNQSLEMSFGAVEIEGEVASFKTSHQKYVFFDLKDANGSVGCFMTIWQMRMPLEDGMKVVVRAVPKVTPWGKFSLTVQAVRLVGEGSLKKSFELLRQKLDKEGLFSPERKRTLPFLPARVAVVSSIEAAGYADFMKIANERLGGVTFLVANVQVQGASAPDQIVRAVQYFNQMAEEPEVIVIVRGGGSVDDLAAFNDEVLVRAIASSRVPVLTGIGHEVDESLSDLAADVVASTPSNAAQMLLPDRAVLIDQVRTGCERAIERVQERMDECSERVRAAVTEVLEAWSRRVEERLSDIRAKRSIVQAYNPEEVLRRGYALVSGEQKIGSVVNITTSKATMKARIETYEKR